MSDWEICEKNIFISLLGLIQNKLSIESVLSINLKHIFLMTKGDIYKQRFKL